MGQDTGPAFHNLQHREIISNAAAYRLARRAAPNQEGRIEAQHRNHFGITPTPVRIRTVVSHLSSLRKRLPAVTGHSALQAHSSQGFFIAITTSNVSVHLIPVMLLACAEIHHYKGLKIYFIPSSKENKICYCSFITAAALAFPGSFVLII